MVRGADKFAVPHFSVFVNGTSMKFHLVVAPHQYIANFCHDDVITVQKCVACSQNVSIFDICIF